MNHRNIAMGVVFAAALGVHVPKAAAQAGETDVGEVSGRVGGTWGGGSNGLSGVSNYTVGASSGVAFARHGMVFFDTLFMPLGIHTIQPWPAPFSIDHSYLIDFGVDFQIRIPVKHRFAPYLIAGTGLLWDQIKTLPAIVDGVPLVRHFNQFNGALHTGAGARYYIGETWGIRPEVKVIVSKQVYTSVSFGVFYVTPWNWP